jgi:hypothetical protein
MLALAKKYPTSLKKFSQFSNVAEYLHLRRRLESKLAAAQEQAATTAAQPYTAGVCLPPLEDWWRDTLDEHRRAMVRDLVRGVVVHPVGRGYRGDTTFQNTAVLLTERGQWAMALIEQDALENASLG